MKKLVILLAACAALSGCNTIAGVGDDISSGARATQNMLN